MDVISFRCAACQQVLRVGADKAGRKAKCTKCGKELTIPKPSPAPAEKAPAAPAAAPAATPAAAEAKKFSDDEDDDGAAYSFIPDPTPPKEEKKRRKGDDDEDEEEEEEEKPKTFLDKAPVVRRKLKKKTVQFAEDWLKFRITMVLVFAGMCGWLLIWLLHTVVVLLGIFHPPAYGQTVDHAAQAGGGEVNKVVLVVCLLAGLDNEELGKTLLIVEEVIRVLSNVLFLAGFCLCLGVPNRFGTRGQAVTLVVLSSINLLVNVLLRLLPVLGAMSFVLVPLAAPEIVLNEADIDRALPIHAFWCGSPFWDTFVTILIQSLYFLEPILFAVFMRTASMCLKDDEWLEPRAMMLMRVGFGQLFILLCFYVLSICGTSSMLRLVLFVNYFLWRGFLLGFVIWYAVITIKGRARVEFLLVPDEDDEGGEDDEDED